MTKRLNNTQTTTNPRTGTLSLQARAVQLEDQGFQRIGNVAAEIVGRLIRERNDIGKIGSDIVSAAPVSHTGQGKGSNGSTIADAPAIGREAGGRCRLRRDGFEIAFKRSPCAD